MSSHLAAQMVDDDWATQRPLIPMCTELTVIAEEGQVTGTETETAATVDWNVVELDEPTDLVNQCLTLRWPNFLAFQSMTEISRRGANLVCLLMLMKK